LNDISILSSSAAQCQEQSQQIKRADNGMF
jgi:hypothetical protein